MDSFTAVAYTAADATPWNEMVANARNATFLLNRSYMEYHADRFVDASLIIYGSDAKPCALFAASRHGNEIRAHGGLTYGGLIMPMKHIDAASILPIFDAVKDYYRAEGCSTLLYKPVPHIYHRYPAEEDLYALFRSGAVMTQGNVSTVIDLNSLPSLRRDTRTWLRRAEAAGITASVSSDLPSFWQMLGSCLAERHNAAPVHSLEEMQRLCALFPDNIRLMLATDAQGTPMAGTVLYLTDTVAHCQYIGSTAEGRAAGAVALLLCRAIESYRGLKRYFDFGTSNQESGHVLDTGLIMQKTGFGGRAILYPGYTITL